ncbi:ABC transporter G family member 50-like [Triticum urartu]|nr:ABC transporter G family member 50-like [Triticum urartu]
MLLDGSKFGALKRREFFDNLLKNLEDDHLRFLRGQKERIDRVDVKLPAIEVRYNNLFVEAECRVTKGNHLPSLWNSTKGAFSGLVKLLGFETERAKTNGLENVSGIIKPCRLTLLLGPPGCGKSTLLRVLAGKLDKSLKVTGDISYNGYELHEFVPEKTAVYINQHDLHIAEMTVRETLDFSAQCQGVGRRPKILKEVNTRESVAGIIPDADIDLYMKVKNRVSYVLAGIILSHFTIKKKSRPAYLSYKEQGNSTSNEYWNCSSRIIFGCIKAKLAFQFLLVNTSVSVSTN